MPGCYMHQFECKNMGILFDELKLCFPIRLPCLKYCVNSHSEDSSDYNNMEKIFLNQNKQDGNFWFRKMKPM